MVYLTKIVKVRLKHDRKFAEWVNRVNHTSRYTYNRAVSTYLFGGNHLDRVVADIPTNPESFRLPRGVDGAVGGNLVTVDWHYHVYAFGPSKCAMKYGMYKELTAWRSETDWLRACTVAYERGAILDASAACRRIVEYCSERPPYRPKDGRIILSSVVPPVRRGDRQLYVPGFGEVDTAGVADLSWDMRSFRIVDVTDRVTRCTQPTDRKFELHVSVCVNVEPRRPTGVARGVDIGGHHLAVTADTAGRVAVHDTTHKAILREIDALKSLRDRRNKGGRSWSRINKKIRRLQAKANNVAGNTINQTVAKVTAGVDAVAVERLSVKGMTAHGGNHKRGMNRSMRENRAGAFLAKLGTKCLMRGVDLVEVSAKNTSTTCHVCGHVDAESRVSRGRFVCTNCHRDDHADVNAAWNILHWAAGKVVLRRPEPSRGNKPTPRMLPAVPAVGAPRKGTRRAESAHLCI